MMMLQMKLYAMAGLTDKEKVMIVSPFIKDLLQGELKANGLKGTNKLSKDFNNKVA